MKKIFADVIQFRGTHYDFGYQQGKQLKDSMMIKNREQQWKVRKPLFKIDVVETKNIFQRFSPLIWEELLGLGDALEWPLERVLKEFGGYRVNMTRSGCSIYVGDNYMIRNYDYHPKTYDGRYVVFQPTDGGNSIIGVSQRITGRSDGMNGKGLAMGYTFMNRKRPGDGFICCMIGRLILEMCSDAEEAVDLLKEIPHRGSFSYVLFDKKCDTPYIVESSPRRVEVRQSYSCTNHFHVLKEENRHNLDDSEKRLKVMDDNRVHNLSANDAFQLLNSKENGVFSNLYGSWAGTIHTSAYLPKDLEAWFTLGGNQEPHKFQFEKWLMGESFQLERIDGEVDTDIPFLNMEKADWFR
jgi:predicted choloylglycine hydrolase